MVATIKFDGEDRLAIVFSETFSYETLAKTKKLLVDTAEVLADQNDNGENNEAIAYLLHLVNEMDGGAAQTAKMMAAYFKRNQNSNENKTVMCEMQF